MTNRTHADQKSPSIPLYERGKATVPLFYKEGLGEILSRFSLSRRLHSILLALVIASSVLFAIAPATVQAAKTKEECLQPQPNTAGGETPDQFKARKKNIIFYLPDFTDPTCQTYLVVAEFLKSVVNAAIQFVLAIAFIFLLITGYQFITSVGDKAGMENAKRSLLYIVIGILAVLGAFMIVNYIQGIFLQKP